MSEKCLLDQWRDMAYDRELSKEQLEKFWGRYFSIERGIYEQLLTEPDVEVKGTVKELAEKYGIYLIAGTMPEKDNKGRVFNTCYVFDRKGNKIGKHRKMHLLIPVI